MEDEEALRVRAYFLWLDEGCPDDRHVDHWLQAESELAPPDAVDGEKKPKDFDSATRRLKNLAP
jgi:hypothetical protein